MPITEFSGRYRFLSNFHPAAVQYGGHTYATVEHAFQAAKTLEAAERLAIRRCETPGKAKRAGREVTLREDWDVVRVPIMRSLLEQKFSERNPALMAALCLTAPEQLVEGNSWGDTFWGVCRGRGANTLGVLLMDIRARLLA
jgi:hypothetical protein